MPLEPGTYWATMLTIYSNPIIKAILGLLAANLLTGIAVSLKAGTFRLGAIADIIAPAMYYLVGGAAVAIVAATVPEEWGGVGPAIANATWTLIGLALVGKILENVRLLGVNVPVALTDRKKASTTAVP